MLEALKVPGRGGLLFEGEDDSANGLVLSPCGDFREAAQHLFGYLRQLDAMPVEEIWAEKLPDMDLGRAINDRLLRASVR